MGVADERAETAGAATVEVQNADGESDVVLVCEHASRAIPAEFNGLGLQESVRSSHIAWDPGALGVARALSEKLDAPLVHQLVSRLVYDCNRPPHSPDAVPEISEVFEIPGNRGLSAAARQDRVDRFYLPFRRCLATLLEQRGKRARRPVIVTVHSFTPVFFGKIRTVGIGILHDSDRRFADGVLAGLKPSKDIEIAENQPYGPENGVTHTLVEHGISRGLLNVMIEMRNDLISGIVEQRRMADRLSAAIIFALDRSRRAAAEG
ncbi:MAG: N-formylglutamate amidohydrolase [Paracoccaceae bacterium]